METVSLLTITCFCLISLDASVPASQVESSLVTPIKGQSEIEPGPFPPQPQKSQSRPKRQTGPILTLPAPPPILVPRPDLFRPTNETEPDTPFQEGSCEFTTTLCDYSNLNQTLEKWIVSKGEDFGWVGGPPDDITSADAFGGYVLYDTSTSQRTTPVLGLDFAVLISPLQRKTSSIGQCINFWYAMDGLSPERLRILLRRPDRLVPWQLLEKMTNKELSNVLMHSDGRQDIVLWEEKDLTNGEWINGQIVYTFHERHMILFEGIPVDANDPNRQYQGYIAMDSAKFQDASLCPPFCTFEGGFCSWTQDANDDFDWSLSRGSINPSTGPAMDRFSFAFDTKGGGYAFINTGYPRRPGDKARLISQAFSATDVNAPLCMRFWTHMYGNGVGALRVMLLRVPDNSLTKLWELQGEQGNSWYQGQVTITSDLQFKIIFEAEVGANNLGDIAIDEISLHENACPIAPQDASNKRGDCTFEVDECGWQNPGLRQRVDQLDWIRTTASENRLPSRDHTLRTAAGSYLTLTKGSLQRGERAWLMSSMMPRLYRPRCLSFWYYMNDPFIDQNGPSLGTLRVLMFHETGATGQTLRPLWNLNNHQGPAWLYGQIKLESDKDFLLIFEGTWGNSQGSEYMAIDDITVFDGACSTRPTKAKAYTLDCDFTQDSCTWTNTSATGEYRWNTATISRRPSALTDHTFGAPMGYVFFDIFSQSLTSSSVTLSSGIMSRSEASESTTSCLSFWFSAIGNGAGTKLIVQRETVQTNNPETNGFGEEIWRTEVLPGLGPRRPEWQFGQIQINTNTDLRISFVGEALNGGYALDDIKVYPGTCTKRPPDFPITESDTVRPT